VDIMAQAKMNTLHLHLTDDQGFSVQVKKYPDLAVPSDIFVELQNKLQTNVEPTKFYYTQDDIAQLIQYAIRRGVRIIPEFGVPGKLEFTTNGNVLIGHTGAWYKAGIVSKCPSFACSRAWSLTLNPLLEKTYEVIQGVLEEMSVLFPDPYMHLGGDEVWTDCWMEDASARQASVKIFEDRLWPIIAHLPRNKTVIRWEET
jgi:hexosaminidase